MRVNIPWRDRKAVAQLIDPDRAVEEILVTVAEHAGRAGVDLFLVGGSLTAVSVSSVIRRLKELTNIPVILFPGDLTQMTEEADAIFLLSLISGRNPELLIGNHVIAAPHLRHMRDRVIPVGYMLIDCGSRTSVEYMSQTSPMPYDKKDIAVATALAGEMLGMKAIYLEGGSGAAMPVDPAMIRAVQSEIRIPLITGGGLDTPARIEEAFVAGADMVVTGNGCEQNPMLIHEACRVRDRLNHRTVTV
ncbi:MAG: geranylgeranylglyceryl/heptaprenylglyceryl phosphate synthase [Bacteroidales bacterium]|nr:geranylgeranylglyceryl/heptaprenylglyceryl phosphate synthase [Bacteroidales bacterium]MDT8374046.1 geranylgeranylglyceryl/heptaprenylglyceryl phosphate synthase [Bacteroidales bacterium]